MATSLEFAGFMVALKKALPRFAPEKIAEVVPIWEPYFAKFGREELAGIMRQAVTRFDQFPSIRELLLLAGEAPRTDEDVGREVAERIWGAIERFGYTDGLKLERVRAAVGEVAWEVVRLAGGWRSVCNTASYDNATTLKAQWRELAQGLSRKVRAGEALDAPPSFDALPPAAAKQMEQLLSRVDVTPRKASK